MTPVPHSVHTAFHRDGVINIAVDVDLTLLDTLTPWLDAHGVSVDDIDYHDESVWRDLSPWLEEHATKKTKWKKPYEFWNDPETYHNAEMNPGVFSFLQDLEHHIITETDYDVNFFICSSCTVHHKVAKILRIKELCGEFFNGFVDTADKHLVDFDVLFDDSPSQILNTYKSGKMGVLAQTPMNNYINIANEAAHIYEQKLANDYSGGGFIALCSNLDCLGMSPNVVDESFCKHTGLNEYNGFWKSYSKADEALKFSILDFLIGEILKVKENK